MKKVLAFLLLFGAGLGLILYFQEEPPKVELPPTVTRPAAPVEPSSEPAAAQGATGTTGPVTQVSLGGKIQFQQRARTGDTRPLLFQLNAEDSGRPAGGATGAWEMTGVEILLFNERTGAVRAKIVGRSASGVVQSLAGTKPSFELEPLIELRDVRITILEDAPIVPLTLEFAAVTADLEARTLLSAEPGRIFGDDLEVRGVGLDADIEERRFEFTSQGRGLVQFEQGRSAELLSRGRLRLVDREEGVTVAAEGGAELLPRAAPEPGQELGAASGSLVAQRIELTADETEAGLSPRSGLADGDVLYTSDEGEFGGDHAVLGFDEDGLSDARLSGAPRVRLPIAKEAPDPDARDLHLTGAGPLDVSFRSGTLALAGPGAMRFGAVQLSVQDRFLGGFPLPDSEGAAPGAPAATWIRALGDVVLEEGARRLETPQLEAWREETAEASGLLHLVASGASRASGPDPSGDLVTMSTGDRLEVVVGGDAWAVPLATEVELSLEGAEPLRARASRVRNLNPETLSFDADGEVVMLVGDRRLRGTSLAAQGPEQWLLTGAPAIFDSGNLHVEAERVERLSATELRAGGQLAGRLRSAEGEFEFDGGEIDIRREVGDDETLTYLTGRGGLHGTLQLGERTQEFRANEIDLFLRAARLPEQSPGALPTEGLTEERVEDTWLEVRAEGHGDVQVSSSGPVENESGTLVRQTYTVESDTFESSARREAIGAPERARFTASGEVHVEGGPPLFDARGERFTIDHEGHGRLDTGEAPSSGRVSAKGHLPRDRSRFDVEADWIEFSREHVQAQNTIGRFLQIGPPDDAVGVAVTEVRGRAGHLLALGDGITFTQGVELQGTSPELSEWSLEAERAEVGLEHHGEATELGKLEAWGGVELSIGNHGRLQGEHLVGSDLSGTMRMTGEPARLERAGIVWQSSWVEFDLNLKLPRSGPGLMTAAAEDGGAKAWNIQYNALETLVQPDRLVQAIQLPVLRTSGRLGEKIELRASWAVLWLDRRGWAELTSNTLAPREVSTELEVSGDDFGRFFQELRESELGGVLYELYLEGPLELLQDGQRALHADAFYLDTVDGHGWIADMNLSLPDDFGKEEGRAVLHADWVRVSEDGAFRADNATVTVCEYEDPHVYIVSKDLRLRLDARGRVKDYELRDNAVHIYNFLTLPLPTLSWDEDGGRAIGAFRFGSGSRFGNFFELGIERDLGRIGESANKYLGGKPDDSLAHYKGRLSILGSRGVLLDLGVSLRNKSDRPYWWDFNVGGLSDRKDDSGLVRVTEDERDALRLWYRSRARFNLKPGEWFDFSFHSQTDPGVQAEFWERQYLGFEERESDLHWRKAVGGNYFHAGARVPADSFRTGIERVPEVGYERTPTPVFSLGSVDFLYSTQATAARLSRREGDFEGPFEDGFGEREVTRVDNTHRIEAPIVTGVAGIKATPFAELRGTYWDEALVGDEAPIRGSLVGGLRLATTLWKPIRGGGVHQLSPFVQIRRDAFVEETAAVPVPFDEVEEPIDGQFLDLGLRSRWLQGSGDSVDLELRATHARDIAPGEDNGWLPIGFFARMQEHVHEIPITLHHDSRFDTDTTETVFSRTTLGIEPIDPLLLELGHRRGVASDAALSYEAATAGARYRWSPKWEFEAYHTVSLQGTSSLGSSAIIRRYGHDLVFEIEYSRRPGEGGSISLDLKPLLGWKSSDLGVTSF